MPRIIGMKIGSIWVPLVIVFVTLSAILAFARTASAEQRVALVIGNSAYPTAALRNPVNDANAMADKLRALGFDVILKTDATQREMTRSFSQFGQKLVPGSVGLFYYAGHGVQVQGKNFLIPVDAEISNEASVRTEGVDVDQLLYQLGGARLSMVILDACRNNPFERRFRSTGGGGLAQIDAPTGSLLAYATAPGKVAADGAGANGLYTAELLKAIDVPGLRIEDVFKQVRINVLKASDNLQIPWESSSLTGEFYFRPGTKAEIENAQLKQSREERAELLKEMEKLRAELLKLRDAAAPAGTAVSISSGASTSPSVESQPDVPTQIALTAKTAPASNPGEWARRITLLEKSRGQLTLSKALALLLDVDDAEDLALLLKHEGAMKRLQWQSAYGIGTDADGRLIWGGSRNWRVPTYARETAVEFCAGEPRNSCKVVMINGEFIEKDFIEVARQLGARNVAVTRHTFLLSLTREPFETRVAYPAGGGGGGAMYGFSSIRD